MSEDKDYMSEPFIVKKIDDEESLLDDYNPQGNTSFSKTCFHGINALSGVGILSVPYALASGGWLSLIILFTVAITTFYCAILIKRCMEMDPLLRSYPDIGYKAFGNTGRVIVSIFMNLELYLVATSFLILEGDNLNKLFSNVMIICFTICTFIYASVAVLGYLMYGSDVESQITLNLPTDKLSSKVAIWTTLVNPIAKFALMVTPIIDAMRSRFSRVLPNKRASGFLLSTILVTSNVIVALLLPFFGDLMSLVGAFLSASASVILPCLCYLKISGKYQRLGFETLVLIGITLTGIVVVITGTYQAVKDIFGRF
ncbi:Transmembrane amino acid transporter family protein [Arabidopsis thaliana]|uniref:Transmembrane amino acid transporter family protein n=1 Tax=Arabidopsis thaliana TaxID=3702 RepID=F4K9Q4_ARATH|nr:Transmembrane amino acid transporter family protein [Arabidopsis thaliana]AED92135.1 Transmembrane amino acid transporter family protein [Arabidopsis thaliana]|eukprot:NP_001031886.1 Transmembrane amino acid transporter family protein [Arabidopsis thaliana]